MQEFLQLSPNELYQALTVKRKQIEGDQRFALETMRLQTFYLINVQLPKKSSLSRPQELMKFEWERVKFEDAIVPDWDKLDNEYKRTL